MDGGRFGGRPPGIGRQAYSPEVTYAEVYDLLYHSKDYDCEYGLIERLLSSYGTGPLSMPRLSQ